jgi:hypothetical protein
MARGQDPAARPKVLGSAPRAQSRAGDTDSSAPARSRPIQSETAAGEDAARLVDELMRTFREQIRRALGVELDHTPTSLAFVDHYLRLVQSEDREAIVTLVAAGAGAYYGELVRRVVGGTWIGDGRDPRRLRLLVSPQFLYFSPVDQALQAIVAQSGEPPDGPIDDAFHVPPGTARTTDSAIESDSTWLEARLAELSPVPEDEFHTLTCRFETLQLMLELLATKHASEGRAPREYGLADYLDVLGAER